MYYFSLKFKIKILMTSLPILMYHNVVSDISKSKGLNIFVDKLEEQFKYLIDNKYTTYHLSELQNLKSISDKSIVLTFDDVTKNQMEFAIPLLQKYGLKATFFIPFKYVGGFDDWNSSSEAIMTIDELKAIPDNIELGYHSFAHRNFEKISLEDAQSDFEFSEAFVVENKLNVFKAIAYPYGKYPKKTLAEKEAFFKVLEKNKMLFALRIGNRVSKFPFKDKYEIQRIDIKGEDSLLKFKLKIKFGKLKLF